MSDMQDLNTIETFAQLSRFRLLTSFIPGAEGDQETVTAVVFLGGNCGALPAVIAPPIRYVS
jgi:hypothetical protein